ncbi:MAG: hypothetical protein FWJ74_11740 [Gemmatimonadota bacterium]
MTEPCPVPAVVSASNSPALRRSWRAPKVEDLPAFVDLTLQSPIVGGEHGFSWLDLTGSSGRLG